MSSSLDVPVFLFIFRDIGGYLTKQFGGYLSYCLVRFSSPQWFNGLTLRHSKPRAVVYIAPETPVRWAMNTHITFVLDSSGSMERIEDDTRGGFNSFLKDQRETEGSATVTLYDFDTNVNLVYERYPIEDAPKLDGSNYTPAGRTALHDAIHRAITETAEWITEADPTEQPDNVLCVVLTDGKENASETHHERVREQVELRREEQGWEFFFIGANQDAVLTAARMGMDRDRALNMAHSGEGTQAAYDSTSAQINEMRRTGKTSGYDESDRQRQREARDQ